MTPARFSLLACLTEKTWPPTEVRVFALKKELRQERRVGEKGEG